MSKLELEEDGIELYSPDEKGERIIEEADLSWGALRSMKKDSFFFRKRKAIALWAFSIFMIGFVITLVSIAVVVIEEHDKVAVNWGYTDLKVEKFKSPAIIVPAGKSKKGFFYDIPKPPGDVMIRALTLDIVDERGKTVPLEQLYNHHIFLGATSNTTFRIMGAVGAEGARIPIQLPKPYGVPVYGREAWVVSFELINQWGLASGADLKVFITYEISYTPNVQPSNIVNWRLLGLNFEERNKTFEWDVPGNGGPGSVIKLEQDYDWGPLSGTTVFSWGHVHIGAINNTLYDLSDAKKGWQVVCVSTPKYAPSGFMTSIDRKEKIHTFPKDGKVRITSYYDNSKNYGKVMSLTATYASVLTDSEDPDEDIRRKLYEKKRMEELITTLGLFNSTITIPLPTSFFAA